MNLFLKCSLFAAMTMGLIFKIQAQEVDLKGKLIDQKGKPIKEAELKLSKLSFSCLSDNSGNFQLSSNTAIIQDNLKKTRGFIGIKNKVLELGNLSNASITVFSINGTLLNRVEVEKQNRLYVDELIPR